MTDLSTNTLKHLLDGAAPGPWIFREDTADTVYGTQEIGHEVYAGQKYIFSAWNDPVIDEHPETLPLAAAAPDLAEEVLRLRKGLKAIYSDLHESALCNGGTDVPYLQGITEQAVETGQQITHLLGDHDD